MNRRNLLGLLAGAAVVPVLAACGDDEPEAAAPPSAAAPSPSAAGDPMAKLAGYRSEYRFPRPDSIKFDDETNLAAARVAQRVEVGAYLDWARTNAHPEIVKAIPRVSVKGHESDIDALSENSEVLDTSPLWGALEPMGRLLPESRTINSGLAGHQVGLPLLMIKTMLPKAEYARLVTNAAFTKVAAGKNLIEVYPYSSIPLTEPNIPQGILKEFHEQNSLRWLVANPAANMSAADRKALEAGGGAIYLSTGYRKLYIDSMRTHQTPVETAQAIYEGLRSVSG